MHTPTDKRITRLPENPQVPLDTSIANKSEEQPAPPHDLIGTADTSLAEAQSEVDREYLAMLEEFSSHPEAPSSEPFEQPTSEFEELLAMFDDEPSEHTLRILSYQSPVSTLLLTGRQRSVVGRLGLATIADLVRNLDSLDTLPNVGRQIAREIETTLRARATSLPTNLDDATISALCQISESRRFAFDIFGHLCSVDRAVPFAPPDATRPKQPTRSSLTVLYDDPSPIQSLDLPRRLTNALRRSGYNTLGEAARLSDDEILSIRGIGSQTLQSLHDTLDALALARSFLANKSMPQEIRPNPQEGVCQGALEGAALARAFCNERSLPIFDEAFMACMPREAQKRIGEGHSPKQYCDAILSLIDDSGELVDVCETLLKDRVAAERSCETLTRFADPIDIPHAHAWEEAARRVATHDPYCSFDDAIHQLKLGHPKLADWLAGPDLNERTATILRMYLAGHTLQECGNRTGISRERVRQIVARELRRVPVIEEDRYRYLFDTYDFTREQFMHVTGEPQSTYVYLHLTSSTSATDRIYTKPASAAIDDVRIPQELRDGIRRLEDRGYLYVDGKRIPITREGIITHIVSRHATASLIGLDHLCALYDQFLADHNLTRIRALSFSSMRSFEAYIDRLDRIMKLSHAMEARFGGSIRYYDAPSMDFGPLVEVLSSGTFGNIECSAVLLMNDERLTQILADLDIHNGYELHYVLSHYCPHIEGLTLGRSPSIVFGSGNRNDQILELIKQLSPVTARNLARAYAKRYGVDAVTFMGSYLADFKIYLIGNTYVYNGESLTDEQREFIASQFAASGRDYVSLSQIKARFRDRFPHVSTSLISASNLEPLGIHPSGGLLVRDGIDERELFGRLLDSKQRFSIDDEDFGKDVFENQAFRAELAIRVRAYQLVEYEKQSYLAPHMLLVQDEPLREEDLRDYLESAIAFMPPETPFTVKSLASVGFHHRLDALRDDYGIGDYFFASILSTGYVGGRLKGTSLGDTMVFCKTLYSFSGPAFIEQILNGVEAIAIEDLSSLLEDRYGVKIDNPHIRSIVRRSKLYLHERLDMVFDSE